MVNGDVVADLGSLADHHTGRVVDEQPVPRMAPGWMSTPVRIRVTSPSVRAATFAPRPHNQWLTAVTPNGMHTWVGEHDLQRAGYGGIAVFCRFDVAPERVEHC